VGLFFSANFKIVSICGYTNGMRLTIEIWFPLTESDMVLAKVEWIPNRVGGVEGGVKGSPFAKTALILFDNVLLSSLRGLPGGVLGNAFCKCDCIGVRSLRDIRASCFIGGVSGGDMGRSYPSK
jgi:hypothetical protein